MMPSAKIVTFERLPPRKHVVEPEHVVLHLARELVERAEVHAGDRDVVPDAIDREHAQREQHAVAQIRDGEDVFQAVVHGSCSVAPPAAAIFSRPCR
jgi:hypothetical protein